MYILILFIDFYYTYSEGSQVSNVACRHQHIPHVVNDDGFQLLY